MTVQNAAIFLQGGSHTAEDVREFLKACVFRNSFGLLTAGSLLVSEKSGTPNMSVDVAPGQVIIDGTEGTYQGYYFCDSRSIENLTISAADATNDRIDLVVAQVEDSAYSGGTDAWKLAVVEGTPAASPVAPTVPDNSFQLATVTVNALATSILNADISDSRPWVGGVWSPGSVTLTGDATGTAAMSPEGDASITVTIDGANHTHTDAQITGTLSNNTTGNADTASAVNVVGSTSDETTWPLLATASGSGNKTPVIDGGLTYNASTNVLSASQFQASGELGGGSLDINGAGDVSGLLTVGSLAVSGTGWTAYTPSLVQGSAIDYSFNNSAWRALGDWVEVVFNFATTTTGTGGSVLRLSIPTGTMFATYRASGIATFTNTTTNIIAYVDYYDGNEVCFLASGDTGQYNTSLASGQVIKGSFTYLKS